MRDADFKLIDRLFCETVEKEKRRGTQALKPEEKVLLLVWHASGIIENGGFRYFYEQELDAEAVAAAYEKIGCRKCADLLRLSLSLFPNPLPETIRTERMKFLDDKEEMLENMSKAFWDADRGMLPNLAEYVKNSVIRTELE